MRVKHYKGGLYDVLLVAKCSESLQELVVYRSEDTGQFWVRPKSMMVDGRFRQSAGCAMPPDSEAFYEAVQMVVSLPVDDGEPWCAQNKADAWVRLRYLQPDLSAIEPALFPHIMALIPGFEVLEHRGQQFLTCGQAVLVDGDLWDRKSFLTYYDELTGKSPLGEIQSDDYAD